MPASFYWLDYETWGVDPILDRPAQFAGLRTDLDLNPIGPPLQIYAYPADDVLPHPQACLITGLTPQLARQKGLREADFFQRIQAELSQAQTCSVGYNNIRFDDQITRFGLYRNFFDPYAHEWQNQNSRWDLIDVLRLAHAVRPEGIHWPKDEQGWTRFKLELLTQANEIEHEAHNALADVQATLALAQLLKRAQPRLFDYCFKHRLKKRVYELIQIGQPIVHVSDKYPARLGCIAVVLPLAFHAHRAHTVFAYDLRQDPELLLHLSAESLADNLYRRDTTHERVALKEIKLNHAPVLAPLSILNPAIRDRWQLNIEKEKKHIQRLKKNWAELQNKLHSLFRPFQPHSDPDQALYDNFLSESDRRLCYLIRQTKPDELAKLHPRFDNPQLNILFFRYRARNWPETLNEKERSIWQQYCYQKWQDPQLNSLLLKDYLAQLETMDDPIVASLKEWPKISGVV